MNTSNNHDPTKMMNNKTCGTTLENIGFYTLSDERARTASPWSRLQRCELLLGSRCNFCCPYCRTVGGRDISFEQAQTVLQGWIDDGLVNVRFSGGEPTLYNNLLNLVKMAKDGNVKRIAVSTNGSASLRTYEQLIEYGVNDFSISLDACCACDGVKMGATTTRTWNLIPKKIAALSKATYVTVGVVITKRNVEQLDNIIQFAHKLGVSDIRVISAAQSNMPLAKMISPGTEDQYPILKYRIQNANDGKPMRGLTRDDPQHCPLVIDDIAATGDYHYPCIIHLREAPDKPIGRNDSGKVRQERYEWFLRHNTYEDSICRTNCLDVCVEYNRKWYEVNSPVQAAGDT